MLNITKILAVCVCVCEGGGGGDGTLLGREGQGVWHREEGGVTEPSGLTLSKTPNMGG